MKKNSTRTVSMILRVLTVVVLSCVAVLLGLSAFGRTPEFLNRLTIDNPNLSWVERLSEAINPTVENEKLRGKRRGAASMTNDAAEARSALKSVSNEPMSPAVARTITSHRNELGQTVYSIRAVGFDVSPPLSELAKLPSAQINYVMDRPELPFPAFRIPHSDRKDPVVQPASPNRIVKADSPAAPSTGFNFLGVIGTGSYPPDTNGSVGNDQYVETVNTRYQAWSLNRATNTPTSLIGPINIGTLWTGFVGGNCATRNDGDPIVVYDKVANRWLISQFTSAATGGFYYQCVAISTSPDAAGTYNRFGFAIPNGNFGDYPHFGVWTDAYYMMAHAFTSTSGSYVAGLFAAMDRAKMLAGDPTATMQVIADADEGGHMPADLDGFAPPPGGAPGIFASLHSAGMYLYRMKVDFATPANTVRTLQGIMPIAPATAACGGGGCIPQPGSTAFLDSLADRLMFRLAYRNFVDHESLVVSHSVDPGVTGVVSGVRWYDFRISGALDAVCSSYPCTYQQGTIADVANGRSRWMPSIAMDGAENILVGYSTTGTANGTDNHSIRYSSRAKTDPLGTMPGPETIIVTGTRNINGERWGDYTSTSIDPADDCTFWHANEFYVTGTMGAGTWRTQVASARFPAGSGAGQCTASTCTTRPSSAPTIGSASAIANNQIQATWTGIVPAPGSYAIERAVGSVGSEGLYQPVGFAAGNATSFTDTTVQGGVTYTYRVLAATDTAGRCQALVRSARTSATATGTCALKPTFSGAATGSSANAANCGVVVNWNPATGNCPLATTLKYNIFRGTAPNFTPSLGTRIASCVPGPSSYVDMNNLTSGVTYYYVVRAEDNSPGNGGECLGGNEESNSVVVAGTPYGSGLQANPGTWTDAGGDANALLQLNVGSIEPIWRFVNTTDDAGANHTPAGAFAYRNAGPTASQHYPDGTCAIAQTPVLTVGNTSVNLTYWERHQLEYHWDGVAVEFSRNGGAWTSMAAPSNLSADGCVATDVTSDWGTLSCTGTPPGNACGLPTTTPVITGPLASGTTCNNWATGALSNYGRRCHLLTGLTAGDTIQFRWRFTSDPGANFAGFYLDDIAVTNILLPNSCTPQPPAQMNVTGSSSRQSHVSGDFDVPLPGVEPRVGNGGDFPIRFSFTNIVTSVGQVQTSCGSISSSTIDSGDGHNFIVHLNGSTCNGQDVTITLTGVHDNMGGTLASASATVGLLIGDANGDRVVNSADISLTKSKSGQAVDATNFREDLNHDSALNSADISLAKSRSGTGLP